jgi:hypothetical protein
MQAGQSCFPPSATQVKEVSQQLPNMTGTWLVVCSLDARGDFWKPAPHRPIIMFLFFLFPLAIKSAANSSMRVP